MTMKPVDWCDRRDHQKCPNCSGEINGTFRVTSLPRVDDWGFPMLDPQSGEVLRVDVTLPDHVVDHSRFNPGGYVPAACEHGLLQNPDPFVEADGPLRRLAVTWLPANAMDSAGYCLQYEHASRQLDRAPDVPQEPQASQTAAALAR